MKYTDSPLVEISGLSKNYGNHPVLKNLNLSLPPGIHALLGPNGSGKTTLVNILSTLIPYNDGEAKVLGLDVRRDRKQLRKLISLTGQYAAVDSQLTGMENMLMIGQLFGLTRRDAKAKAEVLLERFELGTAATRRADTYSGGMRRKLDIAASLIANPPLIYLDEPTTGLDTRSRRALWDQISELAAQGTSVFLTTQYLEEADVLAEQIMVLHRGGIVASGTADELKARVGGSMLQMHNGQGELLHEEPTTGTAAALAAQLSSLDSQFPSATVSVRKPTLDEVFLELTGEATATRPTPDTEADQAEFAVVGPSTTAKQTGDH